MITNFNIIRKHSILLLIGSCFVADNGNDDFVKLLKSFSKEGGAFRDWVDMDILSLYRAISIASARLLASVAL